MPSIFHYTKTNILVEKILPLMQLRTNSLSLMNDPRESSQWAFGSVSLPYQKIFGDYYNDSTHIDCQYKFGQIIKNQLQVVSFSSEWNNEMMWAHYSQNHLGVCLEFDEEKLIESIRNTYPDFEFHLESVDYSNTKKKPWIYWNENLDKESNIEENVRRIYKEIALCKSHFWEKEDEKRLLFLNIQSPLLVPINNSLKAIYLGLNFSYEYLPSIKHQLKGFNVQLFDLVYQNYKYENWLRPFDSDKLPISRKFNNNL